MELIRPVLRNSSTSFPFEKTRTGRIHDKPNLNKKSIQAHIPNPIRQKNHLKSNNGTNPDGKGKNLEKSHVPTMSDIMNSARTQNLDLQLQILGPFFRIRAQSLESEKELGRAEGVIRYWFGGKILHLDWIRLQKETVGIEKSIFGIGLFIGAVAIRHGYEQRCRRAELLAINDTHLYHSKLLRFYTRIGFRAVYEVTGSSLGDFSHMLMWGGVGTRMDADIEHLMVKWCSRFKPT
ncbi:hypothetical protein ACJIZ3_015582 [Penstemon smallii]|uniref:N-acetyltransferase domain-containing protein n=1 Tax=Penstemon smallii TaxID=265156 RepID=A0ABD3RMX3_9LAMI